MSNQASDEQGLLGKRATQYLRSFFNRVDHDWMLTFLRHRIGEARIIRLIGRLLKGGILEDGLVQASEEGTPQGSILSSLLSNIYLHEVLELWFSRRVRQEQAGVLQGQAPLPARKKLGASPRAFSHWARHARPKQTKGEMLGRAKARIQGHLAYYAITDNAHCCNRYLYPCTFVRGAQSSAAEPTLDTGGWLALTRPGLSPGKRRRALLGATTIDDQGKST